MKQSTFVKWFLGLLLLVILFYNQVTRQIIIFFLPLGSGADDVIELVACIALFVLVFVRVWTYIGEKFNEVR